jgi:LA2681-like HEPN
MLRTSFRLCFGILDKIAHAICELFDMSEPDEPLAFERFWRPKGKGLSRKQQERWEKINSIENFSLLALYSQATDLNSHSGEWGNFKNWRNALEHELLILTRGSGKPLDIFKAMKSSRRIVSVDYGEFKDKAIHLLQLTQQFPL